MIRTYRMLVPHKKEALISGFSELMRARSVECVVHENGVSSGRIPFVFWSLDRRLLSRNNWVGINPFLFVDKVSLTVICGEEQVEQPVEAVVFVTSYRAYIPLLFLLLMLVDEMGGSAHFLGLLVVGLVYFFGIGTLISSALDSEIKYMSVDLKSTGFNIV